MLQALGDHAVLEERREHRSGLTVKGRLPQRPGATGIQRVGDVSGP